MKNEKTKLNKTKIVALILLICTVTLMFSSCGSEKIEKPEDTNLEYWLLDRPNKKEWTLISSDCYLAAGYEAVLDENGKLSAPKSAIVYTVKKYPYRDWGILWRISSIKITDPNVYVWGLTINSTREEFVNVMTSLGFELKGENEKTITYTLDRNIITLCYGREIVIWYNIPMFGSYFL